MTLCDLILQQSAPLRNNVAFQWSPLKRRLLDSRILLKTAEVNTCTFEGRFYFRARKPLSNSTRDCLLPGQSCNCTLRTRTGNIHMFVPTSSARFEITFLFGGHCTVTELIANCAPLEMNRIRSQSEDEMQH